MTARIIPLPPVNIGYAQARTILRHHRLHDLEAIDAAFEVLIYSPDEADRALCRVVEDEMWLVPRPGAKVIVITVLSMFVTCIGIAMLIGGKIL
jgi:hypothetical protein